MKIALSLAFVVTLYVTIMDVKAIQKHRITLDDISKEDLNQFLDDILNKRDKGEEEDKASCNLNFREENGIILRTRDSIRRGAEFIAAPDDVDTVADCKEACCGAVSKKTSQHCDVALFQKTDVKDTKARCFLFSCYDENGKDVCVTSPNDNYIMILQIKKEKVEDQLFGIITNSSTIKAETEKTEEKDEHGKCFEQFTNQSKIIIRTRDSIANGAVFLKAPSDADTPEDCQTRCCSTTDESSRHCDLAIFQTNHDDPDDLQPRCFLFSCTDENGQFHCVTSPNDDYVALKRTVDVEEDQLFDVAVSSSTKPATPATTASTTATIIPTTSKLPSTTTTIIPNTSELTSTTTASTRTKDSEQTSAHLQACNRMEWKCDNSLCIKVTQVCDGKLDCSDKSDEKGCELLVESINPRLNFEGKNVEFNLKPEVKPIKPQTQSSTTTKTPMTPKAIMTKSPTNRPVVKVKDNSGAQIPEGEKNSQSTPNFLNMAEKDDFVAAKTEPQKGAVLPLALGLSVTACVLLMVACRFHIMKKKLRRRGKPLSMEESDYLINGMYL